MDKSTLQLNLLKAVQSFEADYKETLNKSDLDEKTFNILYDLGADIKHCFDEFESNIVTYLSELDK